MKSRSVLDVWIEGYLDYLKDVRRLAWGTVKDVRCALRRVGVFMESQRPGIPLWKLTLQDYLLWLNDSRENGYLEAGLAKELSHVRGLLEYSYRSGRSERNVLDGFTLNDRLHSTPTPSLTLEEAERLVKVCGRDTLADRRQTLIVLLLYGCGLRTAELCNLDVPDVVIERQEIFVRKGKGDRQRYVPVPGAVWVELLAYVAERDGKRGPLFKTEIKGRRIRGKTVGEIVREAARRAGITYGVTPKILRHTFGTHLMDRGVDIGVISSLMGHRSPGETGVYLHVLPGKKEHAIQQLRIPEVQS